MTLITVCNAIRGKTIGNVNTSIILLFEGIGYGMVILTGLVSTYYNVILAWALYYLGMSFYPQLPWTSCNNDWNTVHCMLRGMNTSSPNSSLLVENHLKNATNVANNTDMVRTPAEEFWE